MCASCFGDGHWPITLAADNTSRHCSGSESIMDFMKMLGLALVFTHFVASAVALVTILQTDLFLLRRYASVLDKRDCRRIHQAKPLVTAALWVLWRKNR